MLIYQQEEELKPVGMVSICAGEGLSAIFKDLNVDFVIEGGQTSFEFSDFSNAQTKKISIENFSLNLYHIVFENILLSLILNINNLRAKTWINFTNQLESTGVGEGTRNALVYFFPSWF